MEASSMIAFASAVTGFLEHGNCLPYWVVHAQPGIDQWPSEQSCPDFDVKLILGESLGFKCPHFPAFRTCLQLADPPTVKGSQSLQEATSALRPNQPVRKSRATFQSSQSSSSSMTACATFFFCSGESQPF
jgi:hypothetical protein